MTRRVAFKLSEAKRLKKAAEAMGLRVAAVRVVDGNLEAVTVDPEGGADEAQRVERLMEGAFGK